jgi:hypothetical protein
MADDAEKTEETTSLNEKVTSLFFYAGHYGTKEKFVNNFCAFFWEN